METRTIKRCRKYPVTLDRAQDMTLGEQASAAITIWNCLHAMHGFYSDHRDKPDRRYPTLAQMDAAIRQARAEVDFLAVLPAQAAQQVLRAYRQAWKHYWARTHQRPDFKAKKWTRFAVDVPQARDLQLTRLNAKWGKARIPGVGWVKVRMHQSPPDRITGARLVKEATGWMLVVRGEIEAPVPEPRDPERVTGIDRGVAHTLADSDGNFIDQPDTLTPGEARRLYRLERKAARQRRHHVKGTPVSNRLRHTYADIGRLKAKQSRRRYDFAHQTTRTLVDLEYGTYAVEALNTKNMTATARGTIEQPGTNVAQKTGLNRAILDQGWHQIERILTYKARDAGARVVRVPAPGTSQRCHRCRMTTPGSRESQAEFKCRNPQCGWAGNADHNAAMNIRADGLAWIRQQQERGQEVVSHDVEPNGVSQAEKRRPTCVGADS